MAVSVASKLEPLVVALTLPVTLQFQFILNSLTVLQEITKSFKSSRPKLKSLWRSLREGMRMSIYASSAKAVQSINPYEGDWEWYSGELSGVIPPGGQHTPVKMIGTGYLYVVTFQTNSPDLTFEIVARTPHGQTRMYGSPSLFYNLGLTQANLSAPFVSRYDTTNNVYVVAFTPGFPGMPAIGESWVKFINARTTSASYYVAYIFWYKYGARFEVIQ